MKFGYRALGLAGLLSSALIMAGCGAKDNAPPPTPLAKIAPKLMEVNTLWQTRYGVGSESNNFNLGVALWKDQLAVADDKVDVALFNQSGGNIIWDISLDASSATTPALGNIHVFLGTLSGELIALDRRSGKVSWKASLPSSILAQPALSGTTVVVHCHNGSIVALDTRNGKVLWQYQSTLPDIILTGDSAPTIDGNTVLVGLHSGELVALNLKTGQVIWNRPITLASGDNSISRMVDIQTQPLVIGDKVYVAGYQGNIAAISMADGKILWEHPVSTYRDIAFGDGKILVTDAESHIWAFDAESGKVVWVQKAFSNRSLSAPSVRQDLVVVGDFEGYTHWLSLKTGKILARVQVANGGLATPLVFNQQGQGFLYSQNGRLVALKPSLK